MCRHVCAAPLGVPWAQNPVSNSYSKDYDPEDWLQVDGATGGIQTRRVLSPGSPFLKDGWYRAIILALDDGERPASPGAVEVGRAGRGLTHHLGPQARRRARPLARCPWRSWR